MYNQRFFLLLCLPFSPLSFRHFFMYLDLFTVFLWYSLKQEKANTKQMASPVAVAGTSFLTRAGNGLFHMPVHVKPGAKTSGICAPVLLSDPVVNLRIAAPPIEGKANEELVSYLADELSSQLRALQKDPKGYLQGTSFEAIQSAELAAAEAGGNQCDQRSSSTGRKRSTSPKGNKPPNSASPIANVTGIPQSTRVSVSLMRGSTARNKTVAVVFPGSAAYLVAILEKAAS